MKAIHDNWSKALFQFGESDNEHLDEKEDTEFEKLNGRGLGNKLNLKDKKRWIELLKERNEKTAV